MPDILPELNDRAYINSVFLDYDVHFCAKDEVEDLVDFINRYWRENHIFVLSRKLLDWQHFDAKNQRYNFVIAKYRTTGEVHSILGFVPTSQFDPSIQRSEIWPCIWKSRPDIHRKGLGVSLYYFLKENLEIETISILGISETALSIYKHWNFSTGKIKQYYLSNPGHQEILSRNRETSMENAKNTPGWCLKALPFDEYKCIDAKSELFSFLDNYKSKAYYMNRYYKHPIYHYCFWAVMHGSRIMAIVIARECGTEESTCLRIVDYAGDFSYMSNIGYDLKKLLLQNNYEYIDMLSYGFADDLFTKAGFIRRAVNSETVIPNYFEPFLQQNIDLDFAYKSTKADYRFILFKADADQDRPNIL